MSNANTTRRDVTGFLNHHVKINWVGAVLSLFAVVIQGGGAWMLAHSAEVSGSYPDQSTNLSLGVGVIALMVVESLVIVALYMLYKRLSERWRKVLKYTIAGGFFTAAVAHAYNSGTLVRSVALASVATGAYMLFKRFDVYWILQNFVAVILGIIGVMIGGAVFSPAVVLLILVGMLIWDYIAVDLSTIMGQLVEFSSSINIPNYIVVPKRVQCDLGELREYLAVPEDERGDPPDSVASVIGLGDFVFPGILAASAAVALKSPTGLPVIAIIGGTVGAIFVLQAALERAERPLPALPWMNTGAMVGYAIGVLVSGVPILTALGVAG